ncbi:hypothetical protein [Rossellomorea marisflavi]|uniref:hypothetical protein n=1 Tax=Rossellomorea marisflavi TaxID=189381 RepID=UPI00345CC9AC
MKATVKEIAVFYGGRRYVKGEEVTLKKDDFNEGLFVEVEADDAADQDDQDEKGKTKGKKKSDKE